MTNKQYKTGTKSEVIKMMANYAIRDQMALIHAYTPEFGFPDEEAKKVILGAKDSIYDFDRVLRSIK